MNIKTALKKLGPDRELARAITAYPAGRGVAAIVLPQTSHAAIAPRTTRVATGSLRTVTGTVLLPV